MRCIKCNELIGAFEHFCKETIAPPVKQYHPHKTEPIKDCPCTPCKLERELSDAEWLFWVMEQEKYWLKTFWMVYVEGKSGPTMRHDSQQSALAEARRLALMTGKRAYVLEGQCVVEVRANPVDVLPLRRVVDAADVPWAGT